MKLQEEIKFFLDRYKNNSNKLYSAEYAALVTKELFYGSGSFFINTRLIANEETLPMLLTLDQEDISINLTEYVTSCESDSQVYTFNDFSRFNNIGKLKQVWIWRNVIDIKRFDLIKKILKYKNVTIKMWQKFTFYVDWLPMIVHSYSQLDMQTSLID